MHVRNSRTAVFLGEIKWYGPWRQYCFEPRQNTIFNKTCLQDIVDVLQTLNEEQLAKQVTPAGAGLKVEMGE